MKQIVNNNIGGLKMHFELRKGQEWKKGERHGKVTAFEEMVRCCQCGRELLDNKDLQLFVGGRFLFFSSGSPNRVRIYARFTSAHRIMGEIGEITANFPVVNIDSDWQMIAPPNKVWRRLQSDSFVFVGKAFESWGVEGSICLSGEDPGTFLILIPKKSLTDGCMGNIPVNGLS